MKYSRREMLELAGGVLVASAATRSISWSIRAPQSSSVRAASRTACFFYRHDLNFGRYGVPANPHGHVAAIGPATPNFQRVALGAQHQIGTFFESDGAKVVHPEPAELWEWPIRGPLPEDTFYLPRPR